MHRKIWKQMLKLLPENYWRKLLDSFVGFFGLVFLFGWLVGFLGLVWFGLGCFFFGGGSLMYPIKKS